MAKLTAKKRNALKANQFAGPDRSFPVNDKSHARNAKARASQAVNAGRMSSSEKARIDAKADRVLGKSKGEAMKKHEGRKEHEGKRHEKHEGTKRREHEHHKKMHPKREAEHRAEAHSKKSPYSDHPSAKEHHDAAHAAFKKATAHNPASLGTGLDK
jgi:hypothetical protein